MIEWMSAADWAAQGLPGLPSTKQGMNVVAGREAWPSRPRVGRGGGFEYHSSLPEGARAAWLLRHGAAPAAASKSKPNPEPEALAEEPPQEEVWTAYQAAPDHLRQEAERRMKLILDVQTLIEAGSSRVSAVELIAEKSGTAPATLRRWIAAVKRVEQRNWLPALAPRYARRRVPGGHVAGRRGHQGHHRRTVGGVAQAGARARRLHHLLRHPSRRRHGVSGQGGL